MKLMTPEAAMENRQWQIRNAFQEVEDEKLGKYTISANFVKMSESPPGSSGFQVRLEKTTNTSGKNI